MQDLIAKAATLLEALPYIQKFSGATFVGEYGSLRKGMGLPALQTWGFFGP